MYRTGLVLCTLLFVVHSLSAAPLVFGVTVIDTHGDKFLPVAIDDQTTIVGNYPFSPTLPRGGYYTPADGYSRTGVFGSGSMSYLDDVQNGVAVGQSNGSGYQAVKYQPGTGLFGGLTDLDPSSFDDSRAVAINSSGQILIERTSGATGTYLYDGGTVTPLLPEIPVDLNDAGYFVAKDVLGNGLFTDINFSVFSGLFYNADVVTPSTLNNNNIVGGTVNSLPFLDTDPFNNTDGIFLGLLNPGDTSGGIIGLNDGDINSNLLVTFFSNGPGGIEYGVWDPVNGSQKLRDLLDPNSAALQGVSNITILAVTNPNNSDQIAIAALLDGQHATLLLTPIAIPEARTFTLLLSAFLLLPLHRRMTRTV